MHGAPLWARFLTVAAGPAFNFLFSGIIFFLIFMDQGVTKLPLTVQTVYDLPLKTKLQSGDIVKSINNVQIKDDLSIIADIIERSGTHAEFTYVVERNGRLILLENIIQSPPRIAQVLPKSAAISAGLEKGDIILTLNSEKINSFNQIKTLLKNLQGRLCKLNFGGTVRLGQHRRPLLLMCRMKQELIKRIYRIGIVSDYFPFEPETKKQSILVALLNSVESIYLIMEGSVKGLYHILFGNISSCNLSGPISIAETSGQMVKQGGLNYFWFIAVLSTAIGMINLFPIPVLDGGHLLFFAVEAVIGRKPEPSIINKFMTLGFFLLICLMVFSIFNDFMCP